GASHERHKTRGGMRWPLFASRRGADSGGPSCCIPAEDAPRPLGGPWWPNRARIPHPKRQDLVVVAVNSSVRPPGVQQSKPHTPRAERRRNRRSVVTSAHALLTFAHEAMGLAESPAFRAPLGLLKGRNANRDYGRARAVTTTGPAELCLSSPS